MDYHAVFLVQKHYVVVLVNNIQGGAYRHKLGFPNGIEELIVQVHLNGISLTEPRRYFRALSVNLYTLVSYRLVHHALRKPRDSFQHKLVQPLTGIVAVYNKFFH